MAQKKGKTTSKKKKVANKAKKDLKKGVATTQVVSKKPEMKATKDTTKANTKSTKKASKSNTNSNKIETKVASKKASLSTGQSVALAFSVIGIVIIFTFIFFAIPEILSNTDIEVSNREAERVEQESNQFRDELDKQLAEEDERLYFEVNKIWKVDLDYGEFGTLNLELNSEWAPETVENFIRLVDRGYYNDTPVHRIVKQDGFAVIQGGDRENGNGTGGRSARYLSESQPNNVPDELWEVEPQFEQRDEENVLANEPRFIEPSLYSEFDADSGTVKYPKGAILMAKTNQPDSASSQYFITLTETTLPAQYTVFGRVIDNDFSLVDKIFNDVSPVSETPGLPTAEGEETPAVTDGSPNVDLILVEAKIV